MTDLAARLLRAGLSAAEADRKKPLFEAAERRLGEMSAGGSPAARWFAPGRIEVLGKHTDYAGGRSLLCAVERGFCIVARPRADAVVRIADAVLHVETRLSLSGTSDAGDRDGWSAYPAAVVRRIARNFPGALRGADIAFASDLPRSAGLSSSSALVVAVFTALAAANAFEERAEYRASLNRPEDLAGYLGAMENGLSFGPFAGDRGVGTFGGSEDHTAILCCRAGRLAQYAFCPVRFERDVGLPAGWAFVVGASGVAAEKAGGARESYNRLSLAAAAVFELGRSAGVPGETLGAAAAAPGAPERIREILSASSHPRFSARELLDRFDQFVEETEVLVPAAAAAFASGDARALGSVVTRSHAGAESRLRNHVPETNSLVASARSLGAIAASAFGAGFGGSVWALVAAGEADGFRAAWEEDYRRRFPAVAASSEFFVTRPGPGRVKLDAE